MAPAGVGPRKIEIGGWPLASEGGGMRGMLLTVEGLPLVLKGWRLAGM